MDFPSIPPTSTPFHITISLLVAAAFQASLALGSSLHSNLPPGYHTCKSNCSTPSTKPTNASSMPPRSRPQHFTQDWTYCSNLPPAFSSPASHLNFRSYTASRAAPLNSPQVPRTQYGRTKLATSAPPTPNCPLPRFSKWSHLPASQDHLQVGSQDLRSYPLTSCPTLTLSPSACSPASVTFPIPISSHMTFLPPTDPLLTQGNASCC